MPISETTLCTPSNTAPHASWHPPMGRGEGTVVGGEDGDGGYLVVMALHFFEGLFHGAGGEVEGSHGGPEVILAAPKNRAGMNIMVTKILLIITNIYFLFSPKKNHKNIFSGSLNEKQRVRHVGCLT